MRNVVVQVQGKYVVLMNDIGDFIKIKNKDYTIGQRIEYYSVKKKACFARLLTAAAAVVVMLFGGGAYAYYTPYSYVTVDINPSIELEMNIFNRVIDAKAMNEDAKPILNDLQLSGCDINTAAQMIVGELMKDGYLTQGSTAELMVTTSSNNENCAKDILKKAMDALNKETEQNSISANIHGESISKEVKTKADEYGVTPGKLVLADLYAKSSEDPASVDINEWTGKSVKEIVAAIKEENKEQSKNSKSAIDTENNGPSNDKKKDKEDANLNNNNGVGQVDSEEQLISNVNTVNGNDNKENNSDKDTGNSKDNGNSSSNNSSNSNEVNNGKGNKDKD